MKRTSQLRAVAPPRPLVTSHASLTFTALFLLGLIGCAALFFSYRAQDVGQLPFLIRAFFTTREQVISWGGLSSSFAGALIAASIVFSWFGLGTVAFGFIRLETESLALRVSWQTALGASLWSLLWFALGLAGLYRKSFALVLLFIGLGLGTWAGMKANRAGKPRETEKQEEQKGAYGPQRAAILMIAFPLLLAGLAALAAPTGKDALVYRLAVPKAYVAAGGIVDVTTNIFGYLSFGAEMNGVWAMLLGNRAHVVESAFGAVAFAYLPLLLLAVYGVARGWHLPREYALTAVALVAAIPSLYQVASAGYVDHSLALYVILAVQAAGQWWTTERRINLLCLAFALGGALAIKFIALFAFFPLFIVVLCKAREMQKNNAQAANVALLSGLASLVLAGLLASPWYIRTWVRTGSPLYPFYAHLWNGSAPNWDAERSRLAHLWVSRYGGEEKDLLDYLVTPLKLSLQAQPEWAAQYDGVLGISFLLGLPLLLWGWRRGALTAEIKLTLAIAGGWYFCWLLTSQQLRFLLPIFPLLAVALMAVTAELTTQQKHLQWPWLASAAPGLLVIAAWFLEQNPLRVVLGGESREAYLTRRLDHYPYYQIINRDLPGTARVWLINMRNDSVHLERDYFADYVFEDYTITKLVQGAASLEDLRARIKVMGITHIMLRHDLLLDYQRTPIVDERKSEPENQAKLQMLKSLLTAGTRIIKHDAKFMLVQL
jgi:hypothetical protein